jgi:hypothetical protein
MTRKQSTILMIVLGVVICVIVVGVGSAAWLYLSAVESIDADEASAIRSFDDVRARFKGAVPILELREGQPALVRKEPDVAPVHQLQNAQILSWNAEDQTLTRITLPFWLLRLKTSPIDLTPAGGGAAPITLTLEDVERYGPALLLDYTDEDGKRSIVWTE